MNETERPPAEADPRRKWQGRARAKVNLFLRVLAREEGGYHQIETLFQALELSDRVEIQLGEGSAASPGGIRLQIQGVPPGSLGPPEANLAVQAARRFLEEANIERVGPLPTVWIRLEKRIPHGAGLGGGSSDAAAVLRGLTALLPDTVLPPQLQAVAGSLGADVPFFLADVPLALAWGRGDQLLPLAPLPFREVLLLVPKEGISTPWAYRTLAEHRTSLGAAAPAARILDPAALSSWEGVAELAENAFLAALHPHRPDLEVLRSALSEEGASPALLSGSGSALFGVFENTEAVEHAEQELARRFPDVSRLRTRIATWPEASGTGGG